MSDRFDAIIIGAGIIGASVARDLAARGWKTLSVDTHPAAGYGSTAASCAIIRTHYSTHDGCALAYEGVHYWDHWSTHVGAEDERGLARFEKCGCLVYKTAGNGYLEKVLRHHDTLGIPYQDWDADRIAARLPFVDLSCYAPPRQPDDPDFGTASGERLRGAVFFPEAGYVSDPQLATHNVQRSAEARGARFRFNAPVAAIRSACGRVAGVTLASGETVDAPVVINVAGPHSAKVNALAGVAQGMRVTTRALRVEVAHVPVPEDAEYPFVFSDNDIGCYSRPETGNNILIGSEDPECDPREYVDPDDYERAFTEQWKAQVYREAQRIPTLGIPSRWKGVVDLYDVCDDWIPIYDRSDLPGFYMAVGTSGNQFKNAPVAGALMAHLVEACENGHDHDTDPVQFQLEHTGAMIDLSYCSRLREINPDSSFSVLG
jgi:sarcosine oxidase subunit beta